MQINSADIENILFPEMTGWLLWAKIFFILFDLGVIAFIVYVWTTTIYLKRLFLIDVIEFFTYRAYGTRLIDKEWNLIKKRLLTKNEEQFKFAVIEADYLLNDVLTRINFEGKTLGEKLDKAQASRFSDLESLKKADQLYETISHDAKTIIDYQQAKTAILAFERALRDVSAFVAK